jgi:hypothetical protein
MKKIAKEIAPLALSLSEIDRTTVKCTEEKQFVKKCAVESPDSMTSPAARLLEI